MNRSILLTAGVTIATACAAASPKPLGTDAGARAFQKCYSCHALEPGKNDLSGPTLYAIVGRRIATQPGFDYSPALRRFADSNPRWTAALLDRFAADPDALVPGTSMHFHGISDPQERRALLAYLEGLATTSP